MSTHNFKTGLSMSLKFKSSMFPLSSSQRSRGRGRGGKRFSSPRVQRKITQSVITAPIKGQYPDMKIASHGEKIAELILSNKVVAVDSPTGTGKTRYLPYLMAKKGYKIRVSIPTIVAVRNAYDFQVEYSGLSVGFAAGREIKYQQNDSLVYATTGHFTQKILWICKNNENVQKQVLEVLGDILFIDEVHTATSQISLLIGLIKHVFPNDDGPRIVFSTATFNHGDIKSYYPEFPIYKVKMETMKIEDIFLEKEKDPLDGKPNYDILNIIKKEYSNWKTSSKKYHGIVFRPGMMEIEDTIDFLYDHFQNEEITLFPAYAGLTKNEIDEIFKESDTMKIIVGTNMIESSVTVNDVGFIVDDLLEKVAGTSNTGGKKLSLEKISKSSSKQRRGRTGRTVNGRAYKLIDKKSFEELDEFRMREIDSVPIYDIILELVDAGLIPMKIIHISKERYKSSMKVLKKFGMINEGKVTEVGKFVSSVPMSIKNAFFVYLGYQNFLNDNDYTILEAVLVAASMVEVHGPSFFFVPRRKPGENQFDYRVRVDAHREEYHEKFSGKTDIHTFLNIYYNMLEDIEVQKKYTKKQKSFLVQVRDWSVDNSMNNKKIKEALRTIRDIKSTISDKLHLAGYKDAGKLNTDNLSENHRYQDVVAQIFAKAYVSEEMKCVDFLRGRYMGSDNVVYMINRRVSLNTAGIPNSIIPAETIEVVGNGHIMHFASIFVPGSYLDEEPVISSDSDECL